MVLQSVEEMAPLDQQLEKEHQEKTKVKNIEVSPASMSWAGCLAVLLKVWQVSTSANLSI